MVWLLGDVHSVNAHLDWIELPEGPTDAGFCIELEHASGVRSHVEASKVNHIEARELRAYGSEGSYQSLRHRRAGAGDLRRPPAGRRPRGVGLRGPRTMGHCSRPRPARFRVPSEQGRYHDLYTAFAAAIRGEGRQPVPAQ